jgi:hypothetical protein
MNGLTYAMKWRMLCAVGGFAALFGGGALQACQVPVFRYALENWSTAPWRVRLPDTVLPGSKAGGANLQIERSTGLAAMELRLPEGEGEEEPVWTGPADAAHWQSLVDSPARSELSRRLLAGESAVWLLLESGDVAKDSSAAAVLEQALQAAQAELKLPEGVVTPAQLDEPGRKGSPADVLHSDLPLRLVFSVLRLARDDPAEAVLRAMLMKVEPDLADYAGEPMVFAVFGRGRALEPLIGRGIHADNLREAASYLCGACSCEIKEQNPGMDLLLTADWTPVDQAPKPEPVRVEPAGPQKITAQVRARRASLLAAGVLLVAGLAWLRRK